MRAVHRYPDGVEVRDASGEALPFDAVVIATHPDQALRLLAEPTQAEREVLGAFRYTPNPALLHTDASLLPSPPGGPGVVELRAQPLRSRGRGGYRASATT